MWKAARWAAGLLLCVGVGAACGAAAPAPSAASPDRSLLGKGGPAKALPTGALLRLGRSDLAHPAVQGFAFTGERKLVTWGPDREDDDGQRARRWAWDAGGIALPTGDVELAWVVAASPGGRFLLSSDDDFTVFEAETGAVAHKFAGHTGTAAISADGRTIATVTTTGGSFAMRALGDERERVIEGHEKDILGVAFDPKGRWLATSSEDDTVKMWDVAKGTLVRTLTVDRDAWDPMFSADGRRLAARAEDRMMVWDAATGNVVAKIGDDDLDLYLRGAIAISPDGRQVALTMSTGEQVLAVFELEPLRLKWQVRDASASQLAFSPDGSEIVLKGEYDDRFQRLSAADGRRLGGEEVAGETIGGAGMTALAATAERAYTGDGSGAITAWSLADGKPTGVMRGHDRLVRALALSKDGTRLASGGLDRTVVIWNVAERSVVRRFVVPHEVYAVALSDDGSEVVVAPDAGRASVWSVTDGRQVRGLAGGTEGAVARSSDGTIALSQAAGVAVGSPGQWAARRTFATSDEPTAIAFSPDGARLAAASKASLRIWSVKDGAIVSERELGGSAPRAIAWSPSGDAVALSVDATIVVASAAGARRMRFDAHGGSMIEALAFAGEDRLVSASIDGTALVWKVAQKDEPGDVVPPPATKATASPALRTCGASGTDGYGDALPPCAVQRYGSLRFHHDASIRRLAVSPDGSLVAAGGESLDSKSIRVWDRATGALRAELAAGGQVPSIWFSPRGDRLFALSAGRVLSWSLAGDLDAKSVAVGESDYNTLALSPSGALLVAADGMGEVHVLDAATLAPRGRFAVPDTHVVRIGFAGEDELILQTKRLEVSRWRWKDGKRLARVAEDLYGMTVTRDGRTVVGAFDGLLMAGPPDALRATSIEAGESPMALSGDGRRVAIVLPDYDESGKETGVTARVYDLKSGREIAALPVGNTDEVALSGNGDWLVSEEGNRVAVWDVKARKLVATPPTHGSWVGGVGWSASGKVVTIDRNHAVRLWDAKSGARAGGWEEDDVTHGEVSADGRSIIGAVSGDADQLAVWPETGGPGRRKKVDIVSLEPIAVSPDGKRLANAVPLKEDIEIISLDSMTTERRIRVTMEEPESMAFSPDGRLAVSADEITEVFRVADGQRVTRLEVGGAVAFSDDGKYFAVTTGTTIELRDGKTLQSLAELTGAVQAWGPLRFSKRGWLAAVDGYGGIQIWDVEGRKLVTVLEGHDEIVSSLVVSADGRELLSGGWDGTALRWRIEGVGD